MGVFIALLRGINVSGQKKIKMADLRSMLQTLPIKKVETYIQSGNIVFGSEEVSTEVLAASIKKSISEKFGLDVPILVKSVKDFEQLLKVSPYTDAKDLEAGKIYYALLKDAPLDDNFQNLDQKNYPNELFEITPYCVYLNCKNGAGKAKLTNTIIEKKLKVAATTRNHRTMVKLLEMARKQFKDLYK